MSDKPTVLYAGITGSINYGNQIIDYATKKMLAKHSEWSIHEYDSMHDTAPAGDFTFALIPGCTSLTSGQAKGVDSLCDLGVPVFCAAANIWAPFPPKRLLLRSRTILLEKESTPDLRIARFCTPPVGCRDPYTFNLMRENDIAALYMGCPTLLMPADDVCDDGYVLMGFGRRNFRKQVKMGMELARKCPTLIGICHEEDDYERVQAAGWTAPLVKYEGCIESYLDYFRRASMVVTGRVHGALPAIAFGKRVMYYGTRDSRTTLLDELGVTCYDYDAIPSALDKATDVIFRAPLQRFAESWPEFIGRVEEQLAAAS